MSDRRTVVAMVLAMVLVCVPAANAKPRHHRCHHHVHHRCVRPRPVKSLPKPVLPVATAPTPSVSPDTVPTAPAPAATFVGGYANTPGCEYSGADPAPYVGRDVLFRLVVSPWQPAALDCLASAEADGDSVVLDLQWPNSWSAAAVAAWAAPILSKYGSGLVAVGIGNEQEIWQGDTYGIPFSAYAAIWDSVEPLVAGYAPQAVRIAGEATPWMAGSYETVLPGEQALAIHPYPNMTPTPDPTPQAIAWAQANGLQVWATEGMCGPSAWASAGCISAAQLQADGYSLGIDWEWAS